MTQDFGFGGYNRGGGGGLNLRFIIGIVIALGGVISYYTARSVNPTTGVVQHVKLNPQQEISLGLQSAPRMAQEFGGEAAANDPRAAFVQEVGQRVLQNSQARNSPYTANFRYHLLNDTRTINAFALPGGQVFITRALFDLLQDEAELAGVLGHETGHVIARHSAEQLAKGQLGQTLTMAVAVGASGSRDNGYSEAAIASVVNQMSQLRFSREDETQADTFGLQFMSEAGYDPRAMLGVMEILQKASAGGHQPEMLQTHPYPEHRIETIKAWLAQHPDATQGRTAGRKLH